jgi:hypothetical protein
VRKKFNDALDKPAYGAVHSKKEDPEKRDRYNYDPSRYENFVPRGPGHLAHFHAHFMQKTAPLAGLFRQTVEKSTHLYG